MAQNDRDEPGMRVIKMWDKKLDQMNLSFHYHSVIPASSYNNLSLRKQIQDVLGMSKDLTLKNESSAVSFRRKHRIHFLRDKK